MKCPNCGFDRILPMYKVCPKCKQSLNASTAEAPKSEEPQPEPNTKLFTGIFWSYAKAVKDPEAFKAYAQKNPNDSARLLNKWKQDGKDVSALVEAHPMNTPSSTPSSPSSSSVQHEPTTTPANTTVEKPESTPAAKSSNDVAVLSVGKDHKKHYVSWSIAPGQIARNISAQEFLDMSNADGVYVQEGVTAVLFIDGVQAAEMEGGVYTFATEKTHTDARKEKAEEDAEIRAKEGKTLSGDFGLNYVRPSYDTRFSNNNSIYISTLNQYYNYTGDKEFLKQGIVDARKAMNFYMQMYDEERHLNRQSYMIGHEGNKEGATKAEQMSTSLSNGYWDVLYMAEYDFQSNMYFYKALVDLIELEETLEKEGIEVDKSQSDVLVANRDCTKKVSKYDLTIDDLKKIAADVLGALQKSTDDATATGFYDEKTGRFICGYNPQGEKMDFGYVMWNMKAVYYGIANEEQKKSIMDWISGERIVESDKEGEGSYGDDIYYYEFAPRITTVNDGHLFTGYYENVIGTDLPFGVKQIQYGGAAIFLSYYDLMDRIEIYGADNAFDRLKEIQKWYDKVYDYYKNENTDPTPFDFYWDYYKQKVGITPQSGVHDGGGSGIVGLDGEFIESLLAVAAVPYGFFGLDTIDGNTLKVAPTLPEELDYWKIENMAFHKVKYDLSVYENAVRIDSVRGNAEDLSIQVEIPTNKRFYTVYVNGKETTDYTKQDGRVVVTLPFASSIVEVK